MLGLVDSSKYEDDISIKQILNQLYAPYEKLEPNYRDHHSFFNQYQLISSLFTYIVLPKESFFDSIPEEIELISLKDGWGINSITPSITLKYFLRRMRNAISHGNIEFTDHLEFTFIDINSRNTNDEFQVSLSSKQLMDFTQALAYWCITKDLLLKKL